MITLNDIARAVNMNASTVSKALRKNSDLNPKTIAYIRDTAEKLGYKFSIEQNNENFTTIGIVIPEIISQYYTDTVNSLKGLLSDGGYDVIIMISDFSPESEKKCIDKLIGCGICGIVSFTESGDNLEYYKMLSTLNGISFLLISTCESSDYFDNISIDDYQGACLAVKHLIELGHRKIAYIGDKLSGERKRAFMNVLSENAASVPDSYIVENEFRFEQCGYTGMKELLQNSSRPTAVFAAYDNIAIGAMRAVCEANLTVPEDISFVSIDNIKTASYLQKKLTTVTEPTIDLGEIAAGILLGKIKNKKSVIQNVKLRPSLNIGETTIKIC